jgi:hypothetical protein
MFRNSKTVRTQIADLPETFIGVSDEHLESVTGGLSARAGAAGTRFGGTVLNDCATSAATLNGQGMPDTTPDTSTMCP